MALAPTTAVHNGAERIASLVIGLLLVVGAPVGLARFGVPFADIDWAAVPNQLRIGEIPRALLVSLVVTVAWLLWLNFMWVFVAEWRAQRGGGHTATTAAVPGTRYVARRIISGLLFSVHSFGAMAMPPPALDAVAPATVQVDERTEAAPGAERVEEQAQEAPTYLVGRGDTLMTIAAETLGDEDRWSEIRGLNVGSKRPDGSTMEATDTWIMRGQRLTLPDDAVLPERAADAAPGEQAQASPSTSPTNESEANGGDPVPDDNGKDAGAGTTSQSGLVEILPGDNFWLLAEGELEDSWGRDVTDAEVASYHQQVIETNRASLSSVPATPDMIFPGEQFVLPATPNDPLAHGGAAGDPSDRPGEQQSGAAAAGDRDPNERGSGATGTDGQNEGRGGGERSFVDARDGGTVAPSGPIDRSGRRATEEPATSSTSSPSPTPTPTSESTVTTPRATPSDFPAEVVEHSGDRAQYSVGTVAIGTMGAGLLAASFVRVYRRRRRLQWATRTPGRMPEPLEADEAQTMSYLFGSADDDRLDLAEAVTQNIDADHVSYVVVGDDHVGIAGPKDIPQVVSAADVDVSWSKSHDAEDGIWVSLGHDTNEGDVVVNLARAGVLWVTVDQDPPDGVRGCNGIPIDAANVVITIATEIASSSLNDARVILVGSDHHIDLQRITMVDDEVGLVRAIEAIDTYVEHDAVVASTQPLSIAARETAARRGIPVVVADTAPAGDDGWTLEVGQDGTAIEPMGATLQRDWFDSAVTERLGLVVSRSAKAREVNGPHPFPFAEVELANDHDGDDPTEQAVLVPVEGAPPTPAGAAQLFDPTEVDQRAPQVQVLGRVEITGLTKPTESIRALGLIAYLAFHRDGVDADQLMTWVWPQDAPPSKKAFANVVSRARLALGKGADGEPYLHHADVNGVYRLAKEVTTDFDAFLASIERVEIVAEPVDKLEAYEHALELVRGIPFTGGGGANGFSWTDHGLRSHVDYTIDETVHACADLATSLGDTDLARWATRIGLMVIPGCEGCYRRRFTAAAVDTNVSELRASMAELERVVGAELGEPEATDVISADLVEYYESLIAKQTS